jgi:inhibitor of the pro-sigma K processing machinery
MQYIPWAILIVSSLFLFVILVKNRHSRRWLGYLGLNVLLAALLLYLINLAGTQVHLHIPINIPTVTAVGVFGIPGVLLLVVLKLILF